MKRLSIITIYTGYKVSNSIKTTVDWTKGTSQTELQRVRKQTVLKLSYKYNNVVIYQLSFIKEDYTYFISVCNANKLKV